MFFFFLRALRLLVYKKIMLYVCSTRAAKAAGRGCTLVSHLFFLKSVTPYIFFLDGAREPLNIPSFFFSKGARGGEGLSFCWCCVCVCA